MPGIVSGFGQLEILMNDASTAAQVYTTLGMSGLGLHGHVGWWLSGIGLLWYGRWLLWIGLSFSGVETTRFRYWARGAGF